MRSINFTENELDFLRKQYQDELESAQKYVEQVSEILKKLGAPSTPVIKESVEKEPKPVKRRGRKPLVKAAEPREPKKRGRKPRVTISEPVEPKKRGRKPRTKTVVPKVPRKRGRPFKVAVAPAIEPSPASTADTPKKRGRKPRVAIVPKSQPKALPAPVAKEAKKTITKKAPAKRKRKWRGVRLTPMSKPIQLKERKEEPVEIPLPEIGSTTSQSEGPIIVSTEEPKE